MGKMIKYEWRKQRTTRILILVCLLVFLLLFGIGAIIKNETIVAVSILVITFAGMFGVLYVGIENLVILNKDLKTKQSYMLWMVPHSTYEILGAKVIAGILQMFFVFMAFFITGAVTVTVTAASEGSLGELLRTISHLFETLTNQNVNWGAAFAVYFLILISWINVMVVGFLAIILTRTVLLNARFGGFIAIIVFFVINFLIERFYSFINPLIGMESIFGLPKISVFDYIFYIIMTVFAFLITGWIADKKLSI